MSLFFDNGFSGVINASSWISVFSVESLHFVFYLGWICSAPIEPFLDCPPLPPPLPLPLLFSFFPFPTESSDAEEIIIDEEEYEFISKLKQAKQDYRESFEVLKEAKRELDFTEQRLLPQSKEELLSRFQAWFVSVDFLFQYDLHFVSLPLSFSVSCFVN